jgi:hypothetical protein
MFENVQFFSHLHFKIAKSANMTQIFFLLKNINMGIKKTQNFMLISNLGHISTFCNLKMQMRKKLYIFKHFAKSKNYFFANIYHSPCDSHQV